MTTSNFSVVSGIFGFIVTAISLLALVIKTCRSHLPSNKVKDLEELLDETDKFFRSAVEEGTLTEPGFIQQTELHIRRLKTRTHDLRSRVYKVTNLRQDYAEFFRGTSTAIGSACQSLRKLRAQVVTSSEEGREVMERDLVSGSPPSAPPYSPEPRCHLDRSPASQISRPHSCPPTLPTWRSDGVQSAPTNKNPFRNSAQSGSDVQTIDVQNCTSIVCTSATLEPGA